MYKKKKKEIEKMIDRHVEWLNNPKEGLQADFSDMDLSLCSLGSRAPAISLDFAKFSNAKLQGSSFENVSLLRANMEYADLTGASFEDVQLNNASLKYANVDGTFFRHSSLVGSDLEGVRLGDCHMHMAVMRTWPRKTDGKKCFLMVSDRILDRVSTDSLLEVMEIRLATTVNLDEFFNISENLP